MAKSRVLPALLALLLSAGVVSSISQQPVKFTALQEGRLKTLSPVPSLPASPTNRYADHPGAARLGHRLFFEARMSANGQLSCASCHSPGLGWSDGRPTAVGVGKVLRNTPSLLGVGHQRWLFWDGRADSIWAQPVWPLEHPDEMGYSRSDLVRLLASDPILSDEYHAIFGDLPEGAGDPARFKPGAHPPLPSPPQPFQKPPTEAELAAQDAGYAAWFAMAEADQIAATRVLSNVGKALEAYQRKLNPGPSAFDRFVEGLREGDASKMAALSPAAQRGAALFVDRAQCINCHFSPLLSGGQFHNLGLAVAEDEPFDDGRPDGIRIVRTDPLNGRGAFSDDTSWEANIRLRFLSYDEHTFGAYKAPSLRNVARTAPYMHDGRFATLEDVLNFYSDLPGQPPVGHREETLNRQTFSDQEVADLVAFLKSLDSPPLPNELRNPLK